VAEQVRAEADQENTPKKLKRKRESQDQNATANVGVDEAPGAALMPGAAAPPAGGAAVFGAGGDEAAGAGGAAAAEAEGGEEGKAKGSKKRRRGPKAKGGKDGASGLALDEVLQGPGGAAVALRAEAALLAPPKDAAPAARLGAARAPAAPTDAAAPPLRPQQPASRRFEDAPSPPCADRSRRSSSRSSRRCWPPESMAAGKRSCSSCSSRRSTSRPWEARSAARCRRAAPAPRRPPPPVPPSLAPG
jgi:hypothetical protein